MYCVTLQHSPHLTPRDIVSTFYSNIRMSLLFSLETAKSSLFFKCLVDILITFVNCIYRLRFIKERKSLYVNIIFKEQANNVFLKICYLNK